MAKKRKVGETAQVHVSLLDEGIPVIRPTMGVPLGGGIYRLLPTSDYDPTHERWEFPPGSVVHCRTEKWSGGKVLVARELVTQGADV